MKISDIIRLAIAEDIGDGDHTSLATIPYQNKGSAILTAKEEGILAGLPYAIEVFRQTDSSLETIINIKEGKVIKPGDIVFTVIGSTRSIVAAERLVLNILQRLSGIATYTHKLTDLIRGYNTKLLDTRKTTPLLREMEKYAVRIGGGYNHRMGLFDMIMIKDNHVDFSGGIKAAIDRVNRYISERNLDLKIEIEVRNFEELNEVLVCGRVNRIMLDNFKPTDLARAVKVIGGRFETEASGGINEENIRDYAETGVDFISSGALTHHIKCIDLSLKAFKGNNNAD